MKKNYILAAFTALTFGVFGQQTIVNFDSFALGQDTFHNNSVVGYYDFSGIHFENYYDALYNYNTGFSITNKENDTTGDYTNSHSAITASGYNSANYSIIYNSGSILLNSTNEVPIGVYVTNATYPYYSMLNGDQFAKKFGNSTNAQNQVDGTNGEDYFRIIFDGVDALNNVVDSVVFYLADYRFSNNTLDYIVDEWTYVDLSKISNRAVNKIKVRFQSSDNHPQYGMNTPAYVAFDHFIFDKNLGAEVLSKNSFQVGPNPMNKELIIQGQHDELSIQNMQGQVLWTAVQANGAKVDVSQFPAGVYILTSTSNGQTRSAKLIK